MTSFSVTLGLGFKRRTGQAGLADDAVQGSACKFRVQRNSDVVVPVASFHCCDVLTAIIEREESGYSALCPEYDTAGQGAKIEEAQHNLIEAPELIFRVRRCRGGYLLAPGWRPFWVAVEGHSFLSDSVQSGSADTTHRSRSELCIQVHRWSRTLLG